MVDEIIGMVAALPAEAATIRRVQHRAGSGFRLLQGGVGARHAAAAAQSLVDGGVTRLISWGTAGGLEPGLRAGSLIVYQAAIDAVDGHEYRCDPHTTAWLMQKLAVLGPLLKRGLTSPVPVGTETAKTEHRGRFACAAIDMESTAIASVARAAGVRFASVRVIVDPAEFSLPRCALDLVGVTDGVVRQALTALIRRPRESFAMVRLGLSYRRAITQLSRAARLIATQTR
ncbi:MAG: hypothetical protein ACREXT_18395 [Gammaproteobacteria bacterium]